MLYKNLSFTLPAANQKTSQRQWDLAFLTKEQFLAKYGLNAEEYKHVK